MDTTLIKTDTIETVIVDAKKAIKMEVFKGWGKVPKNYLSKTQLGEKGLKPKNKNIPDAQVCAHYGTYDLFLIEEAIPKRKVKVIPEKPLEITVENIGLSLYTVNKAAKRRRDAAENCYNSGNHSTARKQKEEKESLYKLKDIVIKKAINDKIAIFEGVHTQTRVENIREYLDDDGYNYEEWEETKILYLNCVSIGNFRFHTIINNPINIQTEIKDLGDWISEAVPRSNIKIKDAVSTLKKYIAEGLPENCV